MSQNCDHFVDGDDEKFLLDDENTAGLKKCDKCSPPRNTRIWVNHNHSEEEDSGWADASHSPFVTTVKISKKVGNGGAMAMDESHGDSTLEDSPLLINDLCYREPVDDEFHCHDVIVQQEDNKAWKKLFAASILCFLFMIAELVGGYIAGSLAVMTDAAHLFSDFVGFLISLLSIWIARKRPTLTMTFGYHRAEVLGAFMSVLTVWLLAAIFAVLAVMRLWRGDYEIEADSMMVVASLGLVVNIVMGAVLYGFCHTHSHLSLAAPSSAGHHHSHLLSNSQLLTSNSQTNANFQRLVSNSNCHLSKNSQNNSFFSSSSNSNINVRAAAAHVLGDLLQSLGVFSAAVIIKIYPGAKLADPLCTLIFSLIVICTTAKVARDAIYLLLEGSPLNKSKMRDLASDLTGDINSVKSVHELHLWTLSPGKDAVSVHLCVDKFCDRDLVLKKATAIIKSRLDVVSCTIQIEAYNSELVNSCRYCQPHQC